MGMANVFKDDKPEKLTEEQQKFAHAKHMVDYAMNQLGGMAGEIQMAKQHLCNATDAFHKAMNALRDVRALADRNMKD